MCRGVMMTLVVQLGTTVVRWIAGTNQNSCGQRRSTNCRRCSANRSTRVQRPLPTHITQSLIFTYAKGIDLRITIAADFLTPTQQRSKSSRERVRAAAELIPAVENSMLLSDEENNEPSPSSALSDRLNASGPQLQTLFKKYGTSAHKPLVVKVHI